MTPDLLEEENDNERVYRNNDDEVESPYTGIILIAAMIFIFISLFTSNIDYMRKNPNFSRIQGFRLLKIKNIPMAFDIPKNVVDNTVRTDKLANVLYADKKVIYYAYPGSCAESRNFLQNLQNLMAQNTDLRTKYYYYPDPQGSSTAVVCQTPGTTDCIQNFLFQNCSQNACIINGPKRQIKVISSTDAQAAYDSIVNNIDW